MTRVLVRLVFLVLFFATAAARSAPAKAAALPPVADRFNLVPFAGLMQAPTSQFFYLIYGASARAYLTSSGVSANTTFLMRPPYRHAGFREADEGTFTSLGARVAGPLQIPMEVTVGYGRFSGTIEEVSNSAASKRSYSLRGPAMGIAVGKAWSHVNVWATYGLFVGIGKTREIEASVAWPFHFVTLGFGVLL